MSTTCSFYFLGAELSNILPSFHEKKEHSHALKRKNSQENCIDLSSFEFRVYSQFNEDGVLEKIFKTIGTQSKFYVEFGTESGYACNTHLLRENEWDGLLMDGGWEIPEINLFQEFITAENINGLFKKYNVPDEIDLLSIDIDFNDFYVWYALNYKPRVVVIEYNATHLPNQDKVVIYDPYYKWDGTNYFGASILALYHLGRYKGYSLVYAESHGANLFFIRDDIIESLEKEGITFRNINKVSKIYRPPRYIGRPAHGPNGGHGQDPQNRPYTSFRDIIAGKAPLYLSHSNFF
ncbi:MAG: hypothetical protein WAM28_06530 [Chlamydiales bacterium]